MWSLFQRHTRQAKPARRTPRSYRPRLEVLEARDCPSSGGLLDPTFGSGGTTTTVPVSGGRIVTNGGDSVIQPDGKIVVLGSSYNTASLNTGYVELVRYNTNGTLDPAFGKSGVVTTKYSSRVGAWGVTVDPNKNIIVEVDDNGPHLIRYNANGTPDKTFNNGTGTSSITFPGYGSFGTSGVTVETVNGVPKLLVYGAVNPNTDKSELAMARFNLDGTPDTTFGIGGYVVTTNFNPTVTDGEQIGAVAIRPDGTIVAAGTVSYQVTLSNGQVTARTELGVIQYNAVDGTVDGSFGTNPVTGLPGGGIAVLQLGPTAFATGIALQPDGSIVVSGATQLPTTYDYALLARFTSKGILDPNFAGSGYIALGLDPQGANSGFGGVAIQTDGSIVVSAWAQTAGSFLMRFHADGSKDTTFGNAGRAPLVLGPATTHQPPLPVYLQADGKILVTGDVGQAVGAARYLASAPQIGSFTANPNPVTSGTSTTLTASGITDGNPNSTITQVTFYSYDLTGNKVVLGTGTSDGSGDWILNFTVNLASGTYTLYAQAQDSYGILADPAALTLTVQ
jgi:uncharacterized delta-60 repeat protein